MVEVLTQERAAGFSFDRPARVYPDAVYNSKPFSHWYREILKDAKFDCHFLREEGKEYPVIYSRAFHNGNLFMTVIISIDTVIVKHFFGRNGYSVITYRRKEHLER